jgi:hypothetical protein
VGRTNSRFVLKFFSFVNCIDTYGSFHAHVVTLQKKLYVRPRFRLKVGVSTGKTLELRSCSACFTDSCQFAAAVCTILTVTGNVGIQYDLIPEPF